MSHSLFEYLCSKKTLTHFKQLVPLCVVIDGALNEIQIPLWSKAHSGLNGSGIQKRGTSMVKTAISDVRKPASHEKEPRRILPSNFIIPPFAIYVHDSPAGIALVISRGILKRPQ